MNILKWSARLHKWVALVVGIQILLWLAGGFVMSVIPIEQVRGEHKVRAQAEFNFDAASLISLSSAADSAGLERIANASLATVLDKPVWSLEATDGRMVTVYAETAEVLSPIDEALARQIAEADYLPEAKIKQISLLSDPPSEFGRPGPVWQVRFEDRDATTLYIDPDQARVLARRSSTWRFYDFFWKLHVMDYDDGADFNHPLLYTAAGVAVFVALSGLILLFIKMRRSLLVWRRRSRSKQGA